MFLYNDKALPADEAVVPERALTLGDDLGRVQEAVRLAVHGLPGAELERLARLRLVALHLRPQRMFFLPKSIAFRGASEASDEQETVKAGVAGSQMAENPKSKSPHLTF